MLLSIAVSDKMGLPGAYGDHKPGSTARWRGSSRPTCGADDAVPHADAWLKRQADGADCQYPSGSGAYQDCCGAVTKNRSMADLCGLRGRQNPPPSHAMAAASTAQCIGVTAGFRFI